MPAIRPGALYSPKARLIPRHDAAEDLLIPQNPFRLPYSGELSGKKITIRNRMVTYLTTDTLKGEILLRPLALGEKDALLDLRHVIHPVVLMFDGEVAAELLLFQLGDAGRHIDNTLTGGNDYAIRTEFRFILEVYANDAAFEYAQAFDGL